MDDRATSEVGKKIIAIRTDDAKLSYIMDDTSTPLAVYHGFYAPPKVYTDYVAGLVTTDKIFLIAKETKDGAGSTSLMKYASCAFEHAWTDRLTLNYY